MTLADVNVLLAAFRPRHTHHALCRAWLRNEVASTRFGVAPQVLSSVMRVATNPRAFPDPSPPEEALNFAQTLMGAPNASIIQPGPGHWSIFTELVRDTQAKGDRVPDAWFAALAIESGCIWVTLDRGFARFKGLTMRAP